MSIQRKNNEYRCINLLPDLFTIIPNKIQSNLPMKYIINDEATILFWGDGTKTVVKRSKEDEYNKTLGFLWAYFQKTSGLSKTKANEYLKSLKDCTDIENQATTHDICIILDKMLSDFRDSLKEFSELVDGGEQ